MNLLHDFCPAPLGHDAEHMPWLLRQLHGMVDNMTADSPRLEFLAEQLGTVLDGWLENERQPIAESNEEWPAPDAVSQGQSQSSCH